MSLLGLLHDPFALAVVGPAAAGAGFLIKKVLDRRRNEEASTPPPAKVANTASNVSQTGRVNVTAPGGTIHVQAGPPAHDRADARRQAQGRHDEALFRELDGVLPEPALRAFLYTLASGNEYVRSGVRPVDAFLRLGGLTGKQFIGPALRASHVTLGAALGELRQYLSLNFFVYPRYQRDEDERYCLHPEHNIDRGGDGSPESMAYYEKHRDELEALVEEVEEAYSDYREAVKLELAL